jgi:uncharacterized membrane-anchored protein
MITAEKMKLLKKQLSKGEPEGEIKSRLRKDGYTEEEIGALFFNLFPKKEALSNEKSNQKNEGRLLVLIGTCFLIAGISMFVIDTWLSKFAIPLVLLGLVSLVAKYFTSNNNK